MCAVFDFTGVGHKDVQEYDFNILTLEINQLNNTLKLMGVRPIFVGFNPRIVREIVSAWNIDLQILKPDVNFRTSLAVLLNETEKTHFNCFNEVSFFSTKFEYLHLTTLWLKQK